MRRPAMIAAAIALVAVAAVALALFEPWRAFTSSHVDEAEYVAAPASNNADSEASTTPAAPVTLGTGSFVTQEHATSGTATVTEHPDGTRVLRLENLATSDGPDLHVWLSDAPAGGDWHQYDDGRWITLGPLTATHGNQNYAIPPDADLTGLQSVVIWCDRFNVSFGSAPVAL